MNTCVVHQEPLFPELNMCGKWFDLSDTARQILNVVKHMHKHSKSNLLQPRVAWIAEKVGVSIRSIKRGLRELRTIGFIHTQFRGRKGNRLALPQDIVDFDPHLAQSPCVHNVSALTETDMKNLLDEALNKPLDPPVGPISGPISGPDSPMYNSYPVSEIKIKKDVVLGACGSVHNPAGCTPSHTAEVSSSSLIKEIEERHALEKQYVGCILEDGTVLSQKDVRQWNATYGTEAVLGAMFAYRYDTLRKNDGGFVKWKRSYSRDNDANGSKSRPKSVTWVQWALSSGMWRNVAMGARNRFAALRYLSGVNRIFRQVTYATVELINGPVIDIEGWAFESFRTYVFEKTGVKMVDDPDWQKKVLSLADQSGSKLALAMSEEIMRTKNTRFAVQLMEKFQSLGYELNFQDRTVVWLFCTKTGKAVAHCSILHERFRQWCTDALDAMDKRPAK